MPIPNSGFVGPGGMMRPDDENPLLGHPLLGPGAQMGGGPMVGPGGMQQFDGDARGDMVAPLGLAHPAGMVGPGGKQQAMFGQGAPLGLGGVGSGIANMGNQLLANGAGGPTNPQAITQMGMGANTTPIDRGSDGAISGFEANAPQNQFTTNVNQQQAGYNATGSNAPQNAFTAQGLLAQAAQNGFQANAQGPQAQAAQSQFNVNTPQAQAAAAQAASAQAAQSGFNVNGLQAGAAQNQFQAGQANLQQQNYGGGIGAAQNQALNANPQDALSAQQQQYADMLKSQVAGNGPSLAQQQLQQATEAGQKATAGAIASQRGLQAGTGARAIADAAAQSQQQAAQQSAQIRSQEQFGAQSMLGAALGQQRGQNIQQQGQGVAALGTLGGLQQGQSALGLQNFQGQQQLAQQTGAQNAGFQQQSMLANQAAGMQAQGWNQQQAMQNAQLQQQAGLQNAQFGQQANLQNAGFQQQAGLANQQASLQAQGMNQQQALQNAGFQQQTGMTNQQSMLQAMLQNQQLNQQTGAQNAGLGMQANLANQQAGMQAQGMNQLTGSQNQQAMLQAMLQGQSLNQLTGSQNQNAWMQGQGLNLQAILANMQSQQQANALNAGTANQNAANVMGQHSLNAGAGAQDKSLIGNLVGGALSVLSDERLKSDVYRHSDEAMPGVPWASYRYKWEPKGVQHEGVIAQDLEAEHPEMVGRAAGYRTVPAALQKYAGGGTIIPTTDPNAFNREMLQSPYQPWDGSKSPLAKLIKGGMGGGAAASASGDAAAMGDFPVDASMLAAAAHGAIVPGHARVAGDSYENDTVPIEASPGEVVLPRSVTQAPDAPARAASFMEALQARKHGGMQRGRVHAYQGYPNPDARENPQEPPPEPAPEMTGDMTEAFKRLGLPPPMPPVTGQAKITPDVQGMMAPDRTPPGPLAQPPSSPVSLPDRQPAPEAQASPKPTPDPTQGEYDSGVKQQMAGLQVGARATETHAQHVQDQMDALLKKRDEIGQNYTRDMTQAQNRGQEIKDWLSDPKNDVNAGKWWEHHWTGNKIGAIISMVLGGMGAGLTKGPNYALEMLNKQIDSDVEAQKLNVGKKQNLLHSYMQQYRDLGQAKLAAMADLKDAAATMLEKEAANYQGSMAAPHAMQMSGQLHQAAAQHRLQLAQLRQQTDMQGLSMQYQKAQMALMGGVLKQSAGGSGQQGGGVTIPAGAEMLLPKEMQETLIRLPNGKADFARTPKDAEEIKKTQEATTILRQKMARYSELQRAHPNGISQVLSPGDYAAAQGLHESILTDLNGLAGLNRFTHEEAQVFGARIPDLTALQRESSSKAKLDELGKEIDDKVRAANRTYLRFSGGT